MTRMAKIRRVPFIGANWIIKKLLRAGVPMGPMILFTVRGRTTGQPRTTLVDLFERDGRRWLVATHGGGNSNWVRNLRAAGEGILTRGRRRQAIAAVELTPEAAGPVLKEVLGPRLASPVRGLVLRHTVDVASDASLDEFISTAREHPVFELRSPREPSSS
jgi:deazaflavin-dependent oxidoreductase (nitroreductase family)